MMQKELLKLLCISKPTLYKLMKDESFPKPVSLLKSDFAGKSTTRWKSEDVHRWIDALNDTEKKDTGKSTEAEFTKEREKALDEWRAKGFAVDAGYEKEHRK